MRVTANGRTPDRAGKDSLIAPPVARVVLPCSVNERLRSDWGLDFLPTRNRNPPSIKGGVSGAPTFGFLGECQREAPSEEQHGRVEADGVLGLHLTPLTAFCAPALAAAPPISASALPGRRSSLLREGGPRPRRRARRPRHALSDGKHLEVVHRGSDPPARGGGKTVDRRHARQVAA